MPTPSELFDQKLREFEGMEGKLLPESIENRYETVRLAYANANNNYYPAADGAIDRQIRVAAHELRTRSLYAYLMEFKEKGREPDSSVMTVRSCADIMTDVYRLRALVLEMGLESWQAAFFNGYIDHYAQKQLRQSEVLPAQIDTLLGIQPKSPGMPGKASSASAKPKHP